jgi:hypothetical protein
LASLGVIIGDVSLNMAHETPPDFVRLPCNVQCALAYKVVCLLNRFLYIVKWYKGKRAYQNQVEFIIDNVRHEGFEIWINDN